MTMNDSTWNEHVRGMLNQESHRYSQPSVAPGRAQDSKDHLHQLLLSQIGRDQGSTGHNPPNNNSTKGSSFMVHRTTPSRNLDLSRPTGLPLSMSTPQPHHYQRNGTPHNHSFLNRSMGGGLNSSVHSNFLSKTPRQPLSTFKSSNGDPNSSMRWMDLDNSKLIQQRPEHQQQPQPGSPQCNAPVLKQRWACSTIQRYLLRMGESVSIFPMLSSWN